MAVTQITFGGNPVISSSEGVWQEPELGRIKPRYEFKTLAQTAGELYGRVATPGCQHKVTITFLNVPLTSIAGITTRLDAFYNVGIQTLSIPELPAVPNCILEDWSYTTKRVALTSTVANYGAQAGRDITITLTFHQLW